MWYKKVNKMPELNISAVGFGCWGISGEDVWNGTNDADSIKTIHTALDLGINLFDVAPVYGLGHAETVLGEALKGQRDKAIIASKCGLVWDEQKNVRVDLTADSIIEEVEQSLKRLQTDYIDVYQMHWPDPEIAEEESMRALEKLKADGKIRYAGVTNFSVNRTKKCLEVGDIASIQGLYNMLEPNATHYHNIPLEYRVEKEILPFVSAEGMAFFPYSPLFQGLLTDHFKPSANFDDQDVRSENPKLNGETFDRYYQISRELHALAQEIDKPLSQLAINWLTQQDAVTSVIAGGQTAAHVAQNAGASDWSLTADVLAIIDKILAPHKADGLV